MSNALDSLFACMEVNRVIECVRSVYFGGDQTAKKKYSDVLFLADPKFQDPEGWVKKAASEFDTNEVFVPVRECSAEVTLFVKIRLVKAYRTIMKEKRKKKLEPVVSIEEILERVRRVQEGLE